MLNQLKELLKNKENEQYLVIPFFQRLIFILEQQAKEIEELKAEIRRLKGHSAKPNIKPSTLENPKENPPDASDENENENEGNCKRKKKPNLPIDKE